MRLCLYLMRLSSCPSKRHKQHRVNQHRPNLFTTQIWTITTIHSAADPPSVFLLSTFNTPNSKVMKSDFLHAIQERLHNCRNLVNRCGSCVKKRTTDRVAIHTPELHVSYVVRTILIYYLHFTFNMKFKPFINVHSFIHSLILN